MQQKRMIDLSKFEVLRETTQGNLVGGFTAAMSAFTTPVSGDPTNNCNSQNCAAGCGILQNTTKGCGS